VSRIVVVATAGAGGDLQPLIAAAIALRTRGHDIQLLGDRTVEPAVAGLGMSVRTLPPELDLGPALIGAIRDAMSATGGDLNSAGPLVQQRITAWAKAVARPVADALLLDGPDAVVTSLFGSRCCISAMLHADIEDPLDERLRYVGPRRGRWR